MDDERLAQFFGQLNMPDKKGLLLLGRSVIPIIIQACFTDSHHFGVAQNSAQIFPQFGRIELGIVGMKGRGTVDFWLFVEQIQVTLPIRWFAGDIDHQVHLVMDAV